ncbi:Gfo/Idh/MocA family protein [Deinococcus sp.]|uniref:Gfo/Idh/MocA family protein n=1 Tax=Deinococcus sp. TaxID=47478 RepID=UPI003CC6D4E1
MSLRWGLLGASGIAQQLIPAIREAGGSIELVGVRDPASARARAFAQKWEIGRLGSYQDVIDSDVDAIYNPLTNDQHLPWSAATLRAGKHSLTEKPLTLNADEARELADVAAGSSKLLLEAFAYRFTPQIQELLRLVRGGAVGEVRSVRGSFGFHLGDPDNFRWNPAQGGGALYDVGCYPLDLTRLLLGMPRAVTCRTRLSERGADVGFGGVLEYPGALASFDGGFDWNEPHHSDVQIIGTQGVLTLDDPFLSPPQDVPLQLNGQPHPVTPANGFARMVEHFQRAALGQEALLYTPQDSVQGAHVLDAAFQSAREGRQVVLDAGA